VWAASSEIDMKPGAGSAGLLPARSVGWAHAVRVSEGLSGKGHLHSRCMVNPRGGDLVRLAILALSEVLSTEFHVPPEAARRPTDDLPASRSRLRLLHHMNYRVGLCPFPSLTPGFPADRG
jgi:hypothetical protein